MRAIRDLSTILLMLNLIFLYFFEDLFDLPPYLNLFITLLLLSFFIISHIIKTDKTYSLPLLKKFIILIKLHNVVDYCFYGYFLLVVVFRQLEIDMNKYFIWGFWLLLGAFLSNLINKIK